MSIRDNGRGIPVDMHPKFKMPAVELVLTNLHAGGKFRQELAVFGASRSRSQMCQCSFRLVQSGGLSRDERVHFMEFARGHTTQKLKVIGSSKHAGTVVTFKPDATIFTITTEFKFEILANRLRELAFLNPGLEIQFN